MDNEFIQVLETANKKSDTSSKKLQQSKANKKEIWDLIVEVENAIIDFSKDNVAVYQHEEWEDSIGTEKWIIAVSQKPHSNILRPLLIHPIFQIQIANNGGYPVLIDYKDVQHCGMGKANCGSELKDELKKALANSMDTISTFMVGTTFEKRPSRPELKEYDDY